MPHPNAPLLSVPQAAKRLKVSHTTVRRLVTGGQLKGHQVGKVTKVLADSLEQYLNRRKEGG